MCTLNRNISQQYWQRVTRNQRGRLRVIKKNLHYIHKQWHVESKYTLNENNMYNKLYTNNKQSILIISKFTVSEIGEHIEQCVIAASLFVLYCT